jgi:hypothetical protein
MFLVLWQLPLGQALVNDLARGMVDAGVPINALINGQTLFAFWKAN